MVSLQNESLNEKEIRVAKMGSLAKGGQRSLARVHLMHVAIQGWVCLRKQSQFPTEGERQQGSEGSCQRLVFTKSAQIRRVIQQFPEVRPSLDKHLPMLALYSPAGTIDAGCSQLCLETLGSNI
jgi:hypothetical protein